MVYVKINGVTLYLWRAIDHEGEVLESVVTKSRNRKAARKFLKKSMKRHDRPETIVTDRLRSYGAALKDLGHGDNEEADSMYRCRERGEQKWMALDADAGRRSIAPHLSRNGWKADRRRRR